MEHEHAYTLMMDTLDGELVAEQQRALEVHLRACPSCAREWQAILAIDRLFRQTPALAPAAGFTQRTLARLPNHKYRVWTISSLYVALLLVGALPMLVGFWAYNQFGPVLSEPGLWLNLWQTAGEAIQVAVTVVSALLIGAGEFIVQEPSVLGWLLVLAGIVSLWGGMFRQLIVQPRQMSGSA